MANCIDLSSDQKQNDFNEWKSILVTNGATEEQAENLLYELYDKNNGFSPSFDSKGNKVDDVS